MTEIQMFKTSQDGWTGSGVAEVGLKAMARSLPFDYAFGFAQGKLFRFARLGMTWGVCVDSRISERVDE